MCCRYSKRGRATVERQNLGVSLDAFCFLNELCICMATKVICGSALETRSRFRAPLYACRILKQQEPTGQPPILLASPALSNGTNTVTQGRQREGSYSVSPTQNQINSKISFSASTLCRRHYSSYFNSLPRHSL